MGKHRGFELNRVWCSKQISCSAAGVGPWGDMALRDPTQQAWPTASTTPSFPWPKMQPDLLYRLCPCGQQPLRVLGDSEEEGY